MKQASELKACPFCKLEFTTEIVESSVFRVDHPDNEACPMHEESIWVDDLKAAQLLFDTRPIEDAQQATIERQREVMRRAVAVIATISTPELYKVTALVKLLKAGE